MISDVNECEPLFRGADPRLVRRENLRDFTRYVFYGGVEGALGDAEEAEIEWWIQAVETTWAGSRVHPPASLACA